MTETTRAIALQQAVVLHTSNGDFVAANVVATAKVFEEFFSGAPAQPVQTSSRATAGAPQPKTPVGKAAPAAKPAAKPPAKTEEQVAAEAIAAGQAEAGNEYEATKEGVGAVVAALISKGAEARKEAINLLKKYQATSVSGVKETDYADFVRDGSEILASLSADLTA